jgi:O-antigen/teichoic acid export membrane protein
MIRLSRGLAWNSLNTAIAQGCSFLRLIVVAAAIGPTGVGQFAIAGSILTAISVLGELGIKQLFIARRVPQFIDDNEISDAEILGTVWLGNVLLRMMLVALSGLISCIIMLVSPGFMGGLLVLGLAGGSMAVALANPQLLSDERNGEFRRVAICESTGQLCGLASAVLAVRYSQSAWVLVLGQLTASVVTVLASYILLRVPRGLALNWRLLGRLLSQGKPFITIAATTYTTYTLDKVILGALYPAAIVGVYFIAQRLVEVPANLYSLISGRAALPYYTARAHEDGAHGLKSSIKTMLWYAVAFYTSIIFILLITVARFGLKWVPGSWQQGLNLVPLLLVGVAARTGCHILSPALVVLGRVRVDARLKVIESVLYLFLLPIAIAYWAAKGAAVAFSVIYLLSLCLRYRAVSVLSARDIGLKQNVVPYQHT